LLKTLSESFDELRTNGERFEMIEKIPIMPRLSKHSVPFFSNLLYARRLGTPSEDSLCAALAGLQMK